ncbi:hypothetical protein PPROV_000313700 [Pycnococcus provasolii]|uniref:EF-hand domain-containing protein n=1 Tax=Pycnococcus provasolii TaxID=41880 RepID=A0A830HD04_9CHLO|nr:hypothetical protein PPROV_000313700 [Pycnococcus provasolii]
MADDADTSTPTGVETDSEDTAAETAADAPEGGGSAADGSAAEGTSGEGQDTAAPTAAPPAQQDDAAFYGLTNRDIEHAFMLLNGPRGDTIRRKDFKYFANLFFPDISPKDLKALVGNEFTQEKMKKLLSHEDSAATGAVPPDNFDPVAEAFRLLDVDGTGEISAERMKTVFEAIPGVGELADEDLQVIMQMADANGDGKLSFEDFRDMCDQPITEESYLK